MVPCHQLDGQDGAPSLCSLTQRRPRVWHSEHRGSTTPLAFAFPTLFCTLGFFSSVTIDNIIFGVYSENNIPFTPVRKKFSYQLFIILFKQCDKHHAISFRYILWREQKYCFYGEENIPKMWLFLYEQNKA